jgi:hypothetical protein
MKMDLKEYFEDNSGKGVLATASGGGKVDAAIYSTPNIIDDNTVAFVMRDRLTHNNLQSNPYATYLFMENDLHYQGVRLFLKKIKEEKDSPLIDTMKKRRLTTEQDKALGPKFLVYFSIEDILPLIGGG